MLRHLENISLENVSAKQDIIMMVQVYAKNATIRAKHVQQDLPILVILVNHNQYPLEPLIRLIVHVIVYRDI